MSQNSDVLRHIGKFGSITARTAASHLGCYRLAARVYDLKQQGHDIITEMHGNHGKRWATYRLGT